MIREEFLTNNLVRHYSDTHKKLRQIETGILYDEAVDVLPCRYTYEESDEEIEIIDEAVLDEEWPEWVSPDTNGVYYPLEAKVSYNGSHWINTIDGNLWEPGQQGWDEIL